MLCDDGDSLSACDIPSTDATYYPVVTADTNGNVWVMDLTKTLTVLPIWHTDDDGSTWDVDTIATGLDTAAETHSRAGLVMGSSGYPLACHLYYDSGFIFHHTSDGDTWSVRCSLLDAAWDSNDRDFCAQVLDTLTLLAVTKETGTVDSMFLFWHENGAWDTTLITTSAIATESSPVITVHGTGAAFVSYVDSTGAVIVQRWDRSTETFGSAYTLSGDGHATAQVCAAPYIPGNWTRHHVIYENTSENYLYSNSITIPAVD